MGKMENCANCQAMIDLENEGHVVDPEKGVFCIDCYGFIENPVKHSETPWVAGTDEGSGRWWGIAISSPGGDAVVATINPEDHPADALDWKNAAFIIQAVNSHENLVKALEHAVAMMESHIDRYGDPAKLFDLESYRETLCKAENEAWENCLKFAPQRILKLLGLAKKENFVPEGLEPKT